jgi:hypothetical protein
VIPTFKPVEYVSPRYIMDATWQARPETPEELADRFVRQIDLLKEIDPLFDLWTCGARRPRRYETICDRYAEEVAAGLSKDDWGEPVLVEGYSFGAITRGQADARSYALVVQAGAHMNNQRLQNRFGFSTFLSTVPDPEAITFQIFKAVMLSIIEVWSPMEVAARPQALLEHRTVEGHFREPWIQYLAAPLATLVTPPASAVVEYPPGGGLLMSATTETFRVDDPAPLAVAHDIARAIAPLNETPYVKRS